MKNINSHGLFDDHFLMEKLTKLGDQLQKLNKYIHWNIVENSLKGSIIRTIGIARAKAKIGMMNLTYNICRCAQLKIVVAMG